MELKEILTYLGVAIGSPALMKLLEYLKTKRTVDASLYIGELEDRREWIKELQAEIRILKECSRLLEEENLKLERRLYKMEVRNTAEREGWRGVKDRTSLEDGC